MHVAYEGHSLSCSAGRTHRNTRAQSGVVAVAEPQLDGWGT